MRPPDDTGLGPQGEAEWQRLRRQVELAEGFWLCFIFAPSSRSTGVLRRRTERLLRGQTRRLNQYEPSQPDDLPAVLSSLLAPEARDLACHWLETLHLDSGEQAEGPWQRAWVKLAVLMNERRDALRRHLRGGLVLVAPAKMKQHFRDMASDLWSVRALVLELEPVAEPSGVLGLPDVEGSSPSVSRMEQSDSIPDADFALAELQRLQSKYTGRASALASVLMRAVDGLLASGREGEAREAARQAWGLIHTRAQTEPQNSALVLHALAKSEEANGDLAAASDHLEQAVSFTHGQTDHQRLLLLEDMVRLASVRRDWQEASRASTEALNICRQRIQNIGDTPETIRDLTISLNRIGDVRRAQGDLAAAADAYEESLALRRQLRQSWGDTPEILRDLSVSLDHVGYVRKAQGKLAAAADAYEESLALSRQLRQSRGDIPETLRDLSVSLDHVGNIRSAQGDLVTAADAYEESLALSRQLLGDTPETLRDLTVSLNRIGDVRRTQGDLAAAADAYEESLALARQLRQSLGDTPETLRDLSISLNRIGDVRRTQGDLAAASNAYEESLALSRQLRQSLGDTPASLRDLSVSLDRIGNVRRAQGDLSAAADAYEESLALRRQLRQSLGDTPESLRDLTVSFDRIGDVRQAQDNLQTAIAAFEESLTLIRMAHGKFSDIPQVRQDLIYCLTKVAAIRQALGDDQGAQAASAEAEALRSSED